MFKMCQIGVRDEKNILTVKLKSTRHVPEACLTSILSKKVLNVMTCYSTVLSLLPKLPASVLFPLFNKLYVATCSPARDTGSGYVAWGHSTLVGPFGEVLATTEHDEAIIIAEIDYSILEQRRTNLPVTKQRRGDLYQLVDFQRLNSQ